MNKAITDGLVLMPPAFAEGLTVWSKGEGTPAEAVWDGAATAALVPGDADFGTCLEVLKTDATQRVRFTGQTPILPGCYLRIRARFKVVSGNMPIARIGGWPGNSIEERVPGLTESGPLVTPTSYGTVYEVSAIVGTGTRTGVDLTWGLTPLYGHFGIDFTGATGGVIRIESVEIEDVTSVFLRDLMDWVDVRDYGAVGDGVADDTTAFLLADAAAAGRRLLVPEGTYHLADHVTLTSDVRFVGTVQMPADKRLQMLRSFDLDTYVAAFGDEVLAFRKALQAYFNYTDHESLDLCGRSIQLDAPIDMQAAIGNVSEFSIRRVLRNGQFHVIGSPNWDPDTVTATATYSTAAPLELSNVAGIAQIPVGALVTGTGVGREVYVRAKNDAAGRITLSRPLHDAAGTQSYTFTRFKYVLDFSGFDLLGKFALQEIDFRCNSVASGILLAPDGDTFWLRDCDFTKPKDRAITSIGVGCQSMEIDRCNFVSSEINTSVAARTSVGINVNANDLKVRDSRAVRFKHFLVLHGSGHVIANNHWFQGDTVPDGPRTAGVVFTQPHVHSTVTGNYIDNAPIEWTNEHDAFPDFSNEYTFGGLILTGNIFTVIDAGAWYRFLIVKPYGPGHTLAGLTVTSNSFISIGGATERVEAVDDSIAPLDIGYCRNVVFADNVFTGITQSTINPVMLSFQRTSPDRNWICDFHGYLPFDGQARYVTSATFEASIRNAAGTELFVMPNFNINFGPTLDQIRMNWPEAVTGKAHLTVRADWPI